MSAEQMNRITAYINQRTLAEAAARKQAVVAMFAEARRAHREDELLELAAELRRPQRRPSAALSARRAAGWAAYERAFAERGMRPPVRSQLMMSATLYDGAC